MHAPLYFDTRIDGHVIVACSECEYETPAYGSRTGALQAFGEHVANPGESPA